MQEGIKRAFLSDGISRISFVQKLSSFERSLRKKSTRIIEFATISRIPNNVETFKHAPTYCPYRVSIILNLSASIDICLLKNQSIRRRAISPIHGKITVLILRTTENWLLSCTSHILSTSWRIRFCPDWIQ